jgi:hypothetical protein
MRRIEGHGVQGSGALYKQRGQQLAAGGYLPLRESAKNTSPNL